jgi:hypothetical protein
MFCLVLVRLIARAKGEKSNKVGKLSRKKELDFERNLISSLIKQERVRSKNLSI